MGKRLIEGVWDCKHCGNTDIRASLKNCPNCGAPQDKDTTFRLPNKITYVPKNEESKISRLPDWECQFCGSLNSATKTNCRNCGSSRTKENKDYFDLKNKEKTEYAKKDIRWECPSCKTLHPDSETKCKNCGTPRPEKDKKFSEKKEKKNNEEEIINNKVASNNVEESDYKRNYEEEVPEFTYTDKKEYSDNNSNDNSKNFLDNFSSYFSNKTSFLKNISFDLEIFKRIGIILLAIVTFIGFIFLISPKKDTITVNSFRWQRNITIEKEKTVQESDWSIPPGGRLIRTSEEIKSYKEVLDHYKKETVTKSRKVPCGSHEKVVGYTDLGNGHFEEETETVIDYKTEYYTETIEKPVYRKEPVYATKYYYEIDKWFYERSVSTKGNDKNPYWGEVVLGNKERENGRSEVYYITATNSKEEQKEYTLSYNNWINIEENSTLSVKISLGHIISILDSEGNEIVFE